MAPRKYFLVDNASVHYTNITNLYFHLKDTRQNTHQRGINIISDHKNLTRKQEKIR